MGLAEVDTGMAAPGVGPAARGSAPGNVRWLSRLNTECRGQ